MSNPSIKKNFIYSSILTTANYIFPFLTFPYITRVLGPTNIGICNFIDSIIHYFLLISMLGIGTVGVREIAKTKNDPKKLSQTFSSLIVLTLITTLGALFILFICVYLIPTFQEYKSLIWIGALKILFNTLLIEWFFKGIENFRYITIRSIFVRFIYVLCVFLFVREKEDYDVYYLLMTLLIIVNSFFNIVYSRNFVDFDFSKVTLRPYISSLFIMGLYGILTSMYTTFNTTYLGLVAGETEVGYYTTAIRLYSIIIALFSAFTGVMLPRMTSILSYNRTEEFKYLLNRSISILFTFAVPVIIFAVVYAKEIIFIIAGSNFEAAILPMQICMPLLLVIGYEQIIIVQGLMAMDKNMAVFINSILGAVIGVVLCMLLIKSYKSVGASIVWCCSEVAVLCSASYFLNKYTHISFPYKKLYKAIVYNLPLLGILLLFHFYDLNYWVSITISSAITCLYFIVVQYYILKEPFVLNILTSIKNKTNNICNA